MDPILAILCFGLLGLILGTSGGPGTWKAGTQARTSCRGTCRGCSMHNSLTLRVPSTQTWSIYGSSSRNRNHGFGYILHIYVLGSLGSASDVQEVLARTVAVHTDSREGICEHLSTDQACKTCFVYGPFRCLHVGVLSLVWCTCFIYTTM